MANAKKLTPAQITALRALTAGPAFLPAYVASHRTIVALRARGLVENRPDLTDAITSAGRHALFEATGAHGPDREE